MTENAIHTFAYVPETMPGTTPGSPSMKILDVTDDASLSPSQGKIKSNRTKSHNQTPYITQGMKSGQASLPFELSYGALDEWLAAALGGTWSSETAGTPEVLKIGKTLQTFTVEELLEGGSYRVLKGVVPATLNLSFGPGANSFITGSFDCVAMDHPPMSQSSLGAASAVASNDPMGSFEGSFKEGGSSIGILTELTLQLAMNRGVGDGTLGSRVAPTVFDGTFELTGTLAVYFEDETLYNKWANGSGSSLYAKALDNAGSEYYEFEVPSLEYEDPELTFTKGDGIIVSMPWEAEYDLTDETMLKITRSNAA